MSSGADAWVNWTLNYDGDELAWLAIDCPGRSANALSIEVMQELGSVVDELSKARPRGVILYSIKPSGFIVGADIGEFKEFTDPAETAAMVREVHQLFNRIERFEFPTVAKIHGNCLGGGLELALACRVRVALDEPQTRLGLPEILLGIHPGFAGTVRAVERAGAPAAMDLMLTGRSVDARRAQRMGLIDRAVPARHLDRAARELALQPPLAKKPAFYLRVLNSRPLRPLLAGYLRRQVAPRAPEQHYPAPYALIGLWREFGGDRRLMMDAEAASIARLLASSTSRELQRLFFLRERLKAHGPGSAFAPRHVHVVGAGTMGGDIAAWCALRGMRVTLQDREARFIAPAMRRAAALFDKRIRDRHRRQRTHDNLIVDLAGDGLRQADVVIEAIIEDLDAKRALFKQIEAAAKPAALLATNTSSIRLEDIAGAMNDPARLVGVHFFNPVAQMQLIEIIGSDTTDADDLARAAEFALKIDRLPLPAKSSPGFLINRILSPYLQEAMTMVDEGVAPSAVDEAATAFGMPMGPLELADTVGLDICLSVGQVLAEKLGGEVPKILSAKVSQGRLGRKAKVGFYEYQGKRVIRPRVDGIAMPVADIRDRLMLRLVNESVACLDEGVVADRELVDVGMVFGTGFAPFRGGPVRYAAERGFDEIRQRLTQLAEQYGERFTPHPAWSSVTG